MQMDDSWVSAANVQQALSQKSYLLFYRLRPEGQPPQHQGTAMEVEKPVAKSLEKQVLGQSPEKYESPKEQLPTRMFSEPRAVQSPERESLVKQTKHSFVEEQKQKRAQEQMWPPKHGKHAEVKKPSPPGSEPALVKRPSFY